MNLPNPGRGQASGSQRRCALLRAVPNSSYRWKRRAFFGFFVNELLAHLVLQISASGINHKRDWLETQKEQS
jgi:hypothetical protein